MLLIIALVHVLKTFTYALPISTTELLHSSTLVPTLLEQCRCPEQQRSIWDIIWSCFATIFACSWVSVHPNVAPNGEKWLKIAFRRLELMIWVLLTPELILLFAARQWYGARELAKQYKGWTKTHGYFIQMGGFVLYDKGMPQRVLTPANLKCLLQEGSIHFPTITEEEIRDRSKGDGLSKVLVIGQTSWFVAQCIARHAQGLDITELELATVAFAVLNVVMYFLWWNKPLDVRCPVPVHILDRPWKSEELDVFCELDISLTFRDLLTSYCIMVYDGFLELWKSFHLAEAGSSIVTKIRFETLKTVVRYPLVVLKAMGRRIQEMVKGGPWYEHSYFTSAYENHYSTNISSYFAHFDMSSINSPVHWLSVVTSSIAVVFGAIHCVAWRFPFPSHTELVIWRVASVIITGTPIIMVLPVMLRFQAKEHRFRLGYNHLIDKTSQYLQFPAFGLLPIYITARLYLLTEALLALRNLPAGAYNVVQWTTFIPHV